MTMPLSGIIRLSECNTELTKTAGTLVSMNATDIRTLAGKLGSNAIIKMSDMYGKSNYVPGNQSYVTAGLWVFTIPSGIVSITATVVGGGGGGGGTYHSGDNHVGGGGGSGGVNIETFIVYPGEELSIYVGEGGQCGGIYKYGWEFVGTSGDYHGREGGTSYIKRLVYDPILQGTGGGGAGGSFGDGCSGWSGTAGSPLGQAGGVMDCTRNGYPATVGGVNGTAFGKGGHSGREPGSGYYPAEGDGGGVFLRW